MTNPYAPPNAIVEDIHAPDSFAVPADRGTRLGAAILDSLIFMCAVYVPFLVFAVASVSATGTIEEEDATAALVALGAALVGFVIWCGFTLKYMARSSQSIAKKLLQIKVVRVDGSPVSLGRLVWLRNVVVWILSVIPLFGIVDALFIFGEARQCLHDKIADTIVVKA